MKFVALVSGGKDSCFNIMQCIAAGHTIIALANLEPHNHTELDSYMYQSIGHEGVALLGQALGVPLFRRLTEGKSYHRECHYVPTVNDEVEDLYELLKEIKSKISYDAVACGAILSDYQRIRVENVCSRLNVVSLSYLWRRDQSQLLQEMIDCGVCAVLVKVAALGLDPRIHLGATLSIARPHLLRMHDKYGLNVCGEGGEYETFTLDCPLYINSISVDDSEILIQSDDNIAPVGYMSFKRLSLIPKEVDSDIRNRMKDIPIKDPFSYVSDIDEDELIIGQRAGSEESNSEVIEDMSPQPEEHHVLLPFYPEFYSVEHPANYGLNKKGYCWIGGLAGVSDDPTTAMKIVLDKLQKILSDTNYKLEDVCSVTLYTGDMNLYSELNDAYCSVFKFHNPPARVCVQCPLPSNCPVLMDALVYAAPPPSIPITIDNHHSFDDACMDAIAPNKVTMHVQGISHWAPANIGPYSQSVQIGDIVRVAGQIGMVPGNLEIIDGGVRRECKLSLRHVHRIISAVNSNMHLRDVVQGICFVTHQSYIRAAREEWEKRTNNAIVEYLVVLELPKKATVEWQLWAHRHNCQFDYEETGQYIGHYLVSIRRRWNYENKIAAIVCSVESSESLCDESIVCSALEYAVSKLNQDYLNSEEQPVSNLNVYYPVSKGIDASIIYHVLHKFKDVYNLVYTIVPVWQLQHENTSLSICGVRYE